MATSLLLSGETPLALGFTPARAPGWANGASSGNDPLRLTVPMDATAFPPNGVVAPTRFVERAYTEPGVSLVNYYLATFLSDPLAAQTISGTLKVFMYYKKSLTGTQYETNLTVRVLGKDGTVRGTLRALASPANPAGDITRDYELYEVFNGNLTAVTAVLGDRISVELGIRTYYGSGEPGRATLRAGNFDQLDGLANWHLLAQTIINDSWAPSAVFSQNLVFAPATGYVVGKVATGQIQTGTSAVLVDGSAPGQDPDQDVGQTWPLGQRF